MNIGCSILALFSFHPFTLHLLQPSMPSAPITLPQEFMWWISWTFSVLYLLEPSGILDRVDPFLLLEIISFWTSEPEVYLFSSCLFRPPENCHNIITLQVFSYPFPGQPHSFQQHYWAPHCGDSAFVSPAHTSLWDSSSVFPNSPMHSCFWMFHRHFKLGRTKMEFVLWLWLYFRAIYPTDNADLSNMWDLVFSLPVWLPDIQRYPGPYPWKLPGKRDIEDMIKFMDFKYLRLKVEISSWIMRLGPHVITRGVRSGRQRATR